MPRWRTGSKVFRTIYRDNELVGMMDTPLLAAEVVQALNQKRHVEAQWENWKPTPAAVNALPDPIRHYIHLLETRADPSGDVRELIFSRDRIAQLEAKVAALTGKRLTEGPEMG